MTRSVARAAWVGDELLLLAATSEAALERVDAAGAIAGRAVAPAAAGGGTDLLLATRVPRDLLDDPGARMGIRAGAAGVAVTAREVADVLTDLRDFLRECVAPWDAGARAAAIEAVVSLAGDRAGEPLPASLAESLRDLRDALRERRPLAVVDERVDRALAVERLHRIADDAFYAVGWVWEPLARLTSLTAVSPEGERVELRHRAFRHARGDVADRFVAPVGEREGAGAGFVCHFRTATPSRLRDGWVFETANDRSEGVETTVALTTTDRAAATTAIVADAAAEAADAEVLREHHVRPALATLQELRRDACGVATDDVLGAAPDAPAVAVIVPLFERTDLLEHQLVQFAGDPAMRECELIWVLDSPEQRDHARELAVQLFRLYGLPFRLVTLSANGGVALARGAGASLARAERLLFLDSDVLPAQPGWLPRLAAVLDADPRTGAVAPKLLHEDETVQSAGIVFERTPRGAEWDARQRFAGLHRSADAVGRSGSVPAACGACLLCDARAYREVGGMSWMYVQGDYEDADLCMRLAEAGRTIRYAADIELYHLEGQSYASEERPANRRYNRWLHTRLWRERLEALA